MPVQPAFTRLPVNSERRPFAFWGPPKATLRPASSFSSHDLFAAQPVVTTDMAVWQAPLEGFRAFEYVASFGGKVARSEPRFAVIDALMGIGHTGDKLVLPLPIRDTLVASGYLGVLSGILPAGFACLGAGLGYLVGHGIAWATKREGMHRQALVDLSVQWAALGFCVLPAFAFGVLMLAGRTSLHVLDAHYPQAAKVPVFTLDEQFSS